MTFPHSRRILLAAVVTALAAFPVAAQSVLDRIAAVVDREIITQSDLDYSVQLIAMQNKLDPNTPGLKDRVLDGLINEKLILAQALEDSIVVTDDEVTNQLDRQIKALVQQYGSEKRVEEMYNMPISRMKRDFRDEIRKQILVQKIRQTREQNVSASYRDVEQFYETYKDSLPVIPQQYELSHIYIQPKPDSTVEKAVYRKALAIIDSIEHGGDFADFARRYSEDPGSASQGGDLGWVRRGMFLKEFEEAVFSMKDSTISKPVRTSQGYHIIQLLERRGEAVHPRHILLTVLQSKANDDSTIALLNRIRARALAGESFAELARKYSEDPDSKDIGGDLGKIPVDQIDSDFLAVLKPLKPGEISEPSRVQAGTTYGYHIVLVRSITPEHKMNMQDDYQRLDQLTLQFKNNEKYQQWIQELRKSIYWVKMI